MRKVSRQDALYEEAAASYGAPILRLASAYEPDVEKRRDLVQEIHFALWRSFALFDGRCSVRTWVYRVAHNTATTHVIRRRARDPVFVDIDAVEVASPERVDQNLDQQLALDRLVTLIHSLSPRDRQVMLLYLEGLDASSIADITGLSARNVATKVHRIKHILSGRFREGGLDE